MKFSSHFLSVHFPCQSFIYFDFLHNWKIVLKGFDGHSRLSFFFFFTSFDFMRRKKNFRIMIQSNELISMHACCDSRGKIFLEIVFKQFKWYLYSSMHDWWEFWIWLCNFSLFMFSFVLWCSLLLPAMIKISAKCNKIFEWKWKWLLNVKKKDVKSQSNEIINRYSCG